MSIPTNLMRQILSLPPRERFELANQLLDSVDTDSGDLAQEMEAELHRRREEMMRGIGTVPDWRTALLEIEASHSAEHTS